MKKVILLLTVCLFAATLIAQNVGIGTDNPSQKLEVNGAVKIGNTTVNTAGAIRWNNTKNDFEGYNGTAWVSLSGGKGGWGNQQSFATENAASQVLLTNGSGSLPGTELGISMSTSNDILVAGARADNTSASGPNYTGSVHVFKKIGTQWQYKTKLTALSPISGEGMGVSTAIYNYFIIAGASAATIGANNYQGRAMIIEYDSVNNTHASFSVLTSSDGQTNDRFGSSVAMNSNFVLIGAPGKVVNGNSNVGRCYFFKRNGASWTQHSIITPPAATADDYFGQVVAITNTWAVIASPFVNVNGNTDAGRLYLYKYNPTTDSWSYTTSVISPSVSPFENFGTSIHMDENRLVVGADQYIGNQYDNNGKVYVYERSGDSWSLQATLTASDGQKSDAFGSSVYLGGDYLIAGAVNAEVGSNINQGKVYIFKYNGNSWEETAILTSAQNENNANFGRSVIITTGSAVAGAPFADLGEKVNNGRLFFFYQ